MGETQSGLPGMASAAEHEADLRAREEDNTPRGVSRAILAAAIGNGALYVGAHWKTGQPMLRWASGDEREDRRISEPRESVRVLDVCAGFGCWASEMRRLAALQGWPVHITGVELDARKREHLSKWCDAVVFNDWLEFVAVREAGRRVYGGTCCEDFDIAIGNPHFSALTHEDPAQSMPAVLLRHAPAVLLFHQEQSFQKSALGCRTWHAYPPAAVFHVPGSVRFRGRGHGADARCYQATLWMRGHKGPASAHMLPWLEAPARGWTMPPGTEEPSTELPAAPGWRRAA